MGHGVDIDPLSRSRSTTQETAPSPAWPTSSPDCWKRLLLPSKTSQSRIRGFIPAVRSVFCHPYVYVVRVCAMITETDVPR